MSSCKIDHTPDDVKKKLTEQSSFLPPLLVEECSIFLTKDVSQSELNDLFHLLKKYDLASNEEKEQRNNKLKTLVG